MNVIHEDGRFTLQQDGAAIGTLKYALADGRMRIDHVGVAPAYRGQGLARELVAAAARFAHEAGMQIVPVCPYARAVLLRDKTWAAWCAPQ